ncbi:MAG: HesA/MoeB/ThiF family protein [Myxococcales bacterium]|nr:HesA/MoeB/ThiF family protein [Myxococcales bacterium]
MAPMLPPVAIVGCGGLGVPAAWTLAVAGVRHLRLFDPDRVEGSNLHRQVAFGEHDVGQPKAEVLARFLRRHVPGLLVEPVMSRVGADDLAEALAGFDAAIDATDAGDAKFALNDWAIATPRRRTACLAAAIGRTAQHFVVTPTSACFRCLFEAPPPRVRLATCATAGVLGTVTGQGGAVAARALVRALRGEPDAATGALVRLTPRGWLRTAVTVARACACAGTLAASA